MITAAAEARRRSGLGKPDGRLPELARASLRALERAVPVLVLVWLLALQVGRRGRWEAGGRVAQLAAVGLRLMASSHGSDR